MPIYEFTCHGCGTCNERYFSTHRSLSGATLECEFCGSAKLERKISRIVIGHKRDASKLFHESLLQNDSAKVDGPASAPLANTLRAVGRTLDFRLDTDWEDIAKHLESGDTSGTIEIAPEAGFREPGPDAYSSD